MDGLVFIEPTDLYNLLNRGYSHPVLSVSNCVLLLDARCKEDYEESHVITAKRAPKNDSDEFIVPYDAELECKQYVIVYDSNSRSLKENGDAVLCGKVMWDMGSRNQVRILRGGYEDFSALYPFLRTQKILYMPRELDDIKTYPCEVITGFLYLGDWRQAEAAYIQKDLKIRAHVNCTGDSGSFFKEEGPNLWRVDVEDSEEADLHSKLTPTCEFIDKHQGGDACVLVFCRKGMSRAAAVTLAYLMHSYKWTLKKAYAHLFKCCPLVRPNRGFIKQLSQFEEDLLGEKTTDISDPHF